MTSTVLGNRLSGDSQRVSALTWIYFLLVGALSATILLKFAEIEYLELLFAAQLVILTVSLLRRRGVLEVPVLLLRLGGLYAIFLAVTLVLALVSLQNDFYLSSNVGFLHRPFWITLSRAGEMSVDVVAVLYMSREFFTYPQLLRFTAKAYYWTGVLSAVYSIVSYPLDVMGIVSLGSYNIDHRMRGFFNEGGPYGLYMLGVILISVILYQRKIIRRHVLLISFIPVSIATVAAKSKAVFFAGCLVLLINFFMVKSVKRKLALVILSTLTVVVVLSFVNVIEDVQVLYRNAQRYERISRMRFHDYNLVAGRVAGEFIVPRMIQEHPLIGVGWGNYGLVRNDPMYRGASAWISIIDQPSLGILGMVAELGIPLLLYMMFCLFYPYLFGRKLNTSPAVLNLLLLQPIVHLFGAQLNLPYPWVVTALAIGFMYSPPEATSEAPNSSGVSKMALSGAQL